jgi:two-component system sensor histidine kinase BaeS
VVTVGGVAVGAVILTALITFGLSRLGAPQRAVAQLTREVGRLAEVASGLPCERRPQALLTRQFGPRVRFVPDAAPRARLSTGMAPSGRTRLGGRDTFYASSRTSICGRPGTIFVFEPAADVGSVPEGTAGRLAAAAAIGLAGSALVAYAVARRMSRPLGELADSARAFSRGEASSVGETTPADPAEIAELKEAFGEMVHDLGDAREREETFLLSVSHELRTPLTAIRGYGEALADGTAKEPAQAGVVVARESKRLERLVQDLLDLARLSAGEFSVQPQDMDLVEVAGSVVDAMTPAARDVGVFIALHTPETALVRSDADRVHQMVANLVENAVRVTAEGGTVVVEVSRGAIAVADTGPGMEAEDIEHAFERFFLWRKYKGVRPVGSGLGLAVVGELARRLGVRPVVTSTPGSGSRFELRFDA